jgi:acetyltransferase
MEALEKLLVRFSQLVADQVWIKEIDINPLLAVAGTAAGAGRARACFSGRRRRSR